MCSPSVVREKDLGRSQLLLPSPHSFPGLTSSSGDPAAPPTSVGGPPIGVRIDPVPHQGLQQGHHVFLLTLLALPTFCRRRVSLREPPGQEG